MPANNPVEVTAYPAFVATSLLVVRNRGAPCRIQITYDKAVVVSVVEVVLKRNGTMVVTDAPLVDEDDIACSWVFSKHKAKASPQAVAEPQFEIQDWDSFGQLCPFLDIPADGYLLGGRRRGWRASIPRRVQLLNYSFSLTLAISKGI